jgi:Cu/Ag efflux pump CusA
MIRRIVDFSLENRLLIIGLAAVLFIWGMVSFHNLPIEAYPDVADNYVEVITQWPGISAEQVEQQVTIPLETVMNGIPGVVHLRSFSLFGLSDLKLVFEDGTDNAWNRERVLERLSQVTLPPGVVPQMGTDWSPVGQIYFFTLRSTNPKYDPMELKSIEDWVVEKNLKSVPRHRRCRQLRRSHHGFAVSDRKQSGNWPAVGSRSGRPAQHHRSFVRWTRYDLGHHFYDQRKWRSGRRSQSTGPDF